MQKVVNILENNVEWLALALGVAFLGYMVWSYVINPPVVATIGTEKVSPGNVDETVNDGPVQLLKEKMNNSQIPTFTVQDFTTLIPQTLDPAPTMEPLFASVWDWVPAALPSNIAPQQQGNGAPIAMLPQLPAAQPLIVIAGQSSIVSFAPAAQAAPANPANPPAPAPASGRTDVHWVTAAFYIPVGPLTDQWVKAFGPAAPNQPWKLTDLQRNTMVLDITAYRNEKQPDGQWGPDELVARLPNNPVQTIPANLANRVQGHQFLIWAAPHYADIASPQFPALAPAPSGTVWQDPAQTVQSLIQASAGGAAAGGAAAGAPATTPDPSLQILPVKPLPAVAPAYPKDTNPLAPAAPGGQPNPDWLIYINDLVAPGQTYHYKVVYSLANPVFDLQPAARLKNQAWAGQLALTAPMSAPSPDISIEPQTYFYCAAAIAQGNSFIFDVFTWAAGLWQEQQFSASPGDAIGGVSNGVDYSTGYSYVDGRPRNNDYFVTVVDSNGLASVRRASADANSPDHKTRIQWVAQSKATTAPSGGTDNSNGNGSSGGTGTGTPSQDQ
jgi:hypothetical protein